MNNVPEYIDPNVDDSELYDLVSLNASEIVELGGVKMTLSEAMWQIPITADNMPQVISLVYELLDKSREEREKQKETKEEKEDEPEEKDERTEEDNSAEEKQAKSAKEAPSAQEDKKAPQMKEPVPLVELKTKDYQKNNIHNTQANPGTPGGKEQNKDEISRPKNQPHSQVEKIAEPNQSIPAEPEVAYDQIESERPIQETTRSQVTENLSTVADSAEVHRVSEAIAHASPSNIPVPEVKAGALDSSPGAHLIAEDKKIEPLTNPLYIEDRAEPEVTELALSDLETGFTTEDTLLLIEQPEVAGYENPQTIFDQIETNDHAAELADFFEREVLIGHTGGIGWSPELSEEITEPVLDIQNQVLVEAESEFNVFEQMGASDLDDEQLAHIDSSIEKTEDTLVSLVEYIETSEAEPLEAINEILDKITEIPKQIDVHGEENVTTVEEAQAELRELFIELLDFIDLDYTPELVESLASLTIRWHQTAEIEIPDNEKTVDDIDQGSGTHEAIKKLIIGLSDSKSMAQAHFVGRSALRLYSLLFSVTDKEQSRQALNLSA